MKIFHSIKYNVYLQVFFLFSSFRCYNFSFTLFHLMPTMSLHATQLFLLHQHHRRKENAVLILKRNAKCWKGRDAKLNKYTFKHKQLTCNLRNYEFTLGKVEFTFVFSSRCHSRVIEDPRQCVFMWMHLFWKTISSFSHSIFFSSPSESALCCRVYFIHCLLLE